MPFDGKNFEMPAEATTDEPWRLVLLEAAGLIRARGLAKFIQEDLDGTVCLHGAISIARFGYPYGDDCGDAVACKATESVANFLRASGVGRDLVGGSGCSRWNNLPERTADEVIAALEGAACS